MLNLKLLSNGPYNYTRRITLPAMKRKIFFLLTSIIALASFLIPSITAPKIVHAQQDTSAVRQAIEFLNQPIWPFNHLKGCAANAFFGVACMKEGIVKLLADSISATPAILVDQMQGSTQTLRLGECAQGGDCSKIKLEEINVADTGLAGFVAYNTSAIMNKPPILNTYALAQETLANNILNPQPAYAKMPMLSGSSLYSVVKGTWQMVLSFALSISLLILIITGFLIMFNGFSFVNPKLRVTFFSAIPSFFLALLMAVFSLAIASFIWDIVWGASGYLVSIMLKGIGDNLKTFFDPSVSGSGVGNYAFRALILLMMTVADNSILAMGAASANGAISGAMILFLCIFLIFMLWNGLKLFFSLVKKTFILLLSVLFAPLFLIVSALPGKDKMRGDWLRLVTANTLAIPAALVMTMLGFVVVGTVAFSGVDAALNPGGTFFFASAELFAAILALGFMGAIAQTPDKICELLGASDGLLSNELIKGGLEAAKAPLLGAAAMGTSMGKGAFKAAKFASDYRDAGGLGSGAGMAGLKTATGNLAYPVMKRLPKNVKGAVYRVAPKEFGLDVQKAAKRAYVARKQAEMAGRTWDQNWDEKGAKAYDEDVKEALKANYENYKEDLSKALKGAGSFLGIPPTEANIKRCMLLAVIDKEVERVRAAVGVGNITVDKDFKDNLMEIGFSYDTEEKVQLLVNNIVAIANGVPPANAPDLGRAKMNPSSLNEKGTGTFLRAGGFIAV